MTCSLRGLVHHFNNRISEAAAAWIMVGLGIQIVLAPVPSDYRALDGLVRFVSGDSSRCFLSSLAGCELPH